MPQDEIVIRGAREHNLRDVNLRLPKNKLIVMTGVSGSGKSSLAFDTLYAEGQRRYVESLSTYARQFLGQLPRPDVDTITGLSPSISIQQKSTSRNPRSTVGTITEIYDYLRVLFARVGQGYCYVSGKPIQAQTVDQIVDSIAIQPAGTRFRILAPVVRQQKGEFRDLFEDLLKRGFLRARVDGEDVSLTEDLQLKRHHKHNIEVIVDRLVAGQTGRTRLAEAVENAIRLSGGTLIVSTVDERQSGPAPGTEEATTTQRRKRAGRSRSGERLYSAKYSCPESGMSYEPPSPQLFSFNSPVGMCLECNGLGMRHEFVIDQLIADDGKSIRNGALNLLGPLKKIGRWRRHIFQGVAAAIEADLDLETDSVLTTPWCDLPDDAKTLFLYGMGERHIAFSWKHAGGVWKHGGTWEGFIGTLLDSYRTSRNPMRRRQLEKFMQFVACSACKGERLNRQARHVRIRSAARRFQKRSESAEKNLPEVCHLTISEAAKFFESLKLDATQQLIADEILKEIRGRLGFLLRCGLDYLTLDRSAPTLSGGESQRIRLAGQIGCGLTGVVYILDEPSIGLHPRDNQMLLDSLCELRDQGNTVIVVEHDEETMRAADHIVDFGPGPGVRGGEVVVEGSVATVQREARSVTGRFLSGKQSIAVPQQRRPRGDKAITVVGARHNNLRDVRVDFPLESFVCVTGVSGSGKSSLVNDILWQVLNRDVNQGNGNPGQHTRVNGLQHIDKAIDIDQSPIGRTPRSNPATYVKLLDLIRTLFTQLPASKMRGYKPGRFSFNVPAGRCEACEGYGATKLEMDFLADIWVQCPVCAGRRFSQETLEVAFRERNIAEILELDVQDALDIFENQPKIRRMLETLHAVGLDYLKLGQPSPTLSGGEAQRIKLARELGKRSTGRTVYLLDEPTTGLHFADVQKLLEVLHTLVDAGNTVIVVEHNLDVIKTADWVIDLGPEGGAGGGAILAEGTPEDIAGCRKSYTGQALVDVLSPKKARRSKASTGRAKRGRNGRQRETAITIRGARQHNLQDVDLTVPHNRINVFCGPSGSGKSSLAMDTLYAEGQRRYVESLSAYARQFLGQMPKPRVEHIHGLSPAIAIEQKTVGQTPRSTVGTVTELYDYLRILFARLGQLFCPDCHQPVTRQTTDEIVERVFDLPPQTRLLILAPQHVDIGQSYEKYWQRLKSQGFVRVRIDGTTCDLDKVPEIDHRRTHSIEIVIDRVTVDRKSRGRIADSIEAALERGRGVVHVAHADSDVDEADWRVDRLSLHYSCPGTDGNPCQRIFEELTPQRFSFNSPLGWCPSCEGLAVERGTNLSALVAHPDASLANGAVTAWPGVDNELFGRILESLSRECDIPLDVPWYQLDPRQQRIVLYGSGDRWVTVELASRTFRIQYKGLYPAIEEASRVSYAYRRNLIDLIGDKPCSTCDGGRIRDDAAAVRLRGITLPQLCALPLNEALEFLKSSKLSAVDRKIAGDLLNEAVHRLTFLVDVGLEYLTLNRSMPTLSGGESQRIRLAGQIGRALTGVLYVLDEPTIGLHPRDNGRLLRALNNLRDLGNTIVMVEHDREVIEAADNLYDFGPGAGRLGGNIVESGTPKHVSRKASNSLTGQYLSGRRDILIPTQRRMASIADDPQPPGPGWVELFGASENNLRDVDLRIPLGTFTCVTGVSGSGKSSLIDSTLARVISRHFQRKGDTPGPHRGVRGVTLINKLVVVDQQPLGNTPASNPATYTGVFDHIRELFTRMPEARVRGYRAGRFSFNRAGGRCEDCEGLGQKKIEMHFLPDVWVECTTCRGKRYNAETLSVLFRSKSIADVLDMPIGEALDLFDNVPKIRGPLSTLAAIGLNYLTLGQSAPTLSGGEAQRVKLAAELARPGSGQTLYLLDEPTTGLHFDDIDKLLKVLNSLVEAGNTVVVIEHNVDVIKTADWIIDLGPEAGIGGGWIVAQGTPEDVVDSARRQQAHASRSNGEAKRKSKRKSKSPRSAADAPVSPPMFRSWTGEILDPVLTTGTRGTRDVFDAKAALKRRDEDLRFSEIGRESKLPWQVDGERWHTVDRIGHNSKPAQWQGSALKMVIDILKKKKQLADPNWNHRSIVEVLSAHKTGGWFLHALTGDEWLLTLKFRVKKSTFKQDELQRQLPLEAIDNIDEIPVYGRSDRLRVKNLKGPWQEITMTVHWLREIDTDAFRSFLNAAVDAYLQQASVGKANPKELTPWKILGRKWHVSRKGFPSQRRVAWDAELIECLATQLESAMPAGAIDWTNKQVVYFRQSADGPVRAELHTKRREGVDLTLLTEPGRLTLGRIAGFGSDRSVSKHRSGNDAVKIRFDSVSQVDVPELKQLLADIVAIPNR